MNAVDTNILVYALCADEPVKGDVAMRFLDGLTAGDTVLLWQVACELGAVLTRLRSVEGASIDAAEAVQAYCSRFPLVLPTPNVLTEGLRIHQEQQVSYWDALLLGACVDAGIARLYTEDLPSSPMIRDVQIINPFV